MPGWNASEYAYVWAQVGSRPTMVRDNRHDSAHLFGAMCSTRGVGAAIVMPVMNTAAMNELALLTNSGPEC
jgi:hypothetical protein